MNDGWEKQIDGIAVPDVTEIKTDIATIKADMQSFNKEVDKLELKINDKNPLAG